MATTLDYELDERIVGACVMARPFAGALRLFSPVGRAPVYRQIARGFVYIATDE